MQTIENKGIEWVVMRVVIASEVFWVVAVLGYEKELGRRLAVNDLQRVLSPAHTRRKALETLERDG